jgi:hypothetical protein
MVSPSFAAATKVGLAVLAGVAIAGTAGAAGAQTASGGSASANYSRSGDQEDLSIADGGRDANGGAATLDGLIQTSPDESALAAAGAAGAFDTVAGVGAGAGSTAVGGNLQIVTGGGYAVVSSSDQPKTGKVSATPAR